MKDHSWSFQLRASLYRAAAPRPPSPFVGTSLRANVSRISSGAEGDLLLHPEFRRHVGRFLTGQKCDGVRFLHLKPQHRSWLLSNPKRTSDRRKCSLVLATPNEPGLMVGHHSQRKRVPVELGPEFQGAACPKSRRLRKQQLTGLRHQLSAA
jgi:hypothetical protein